MSRRSKSRKKATDLLSEVERLGKKGETGILTVSEATEASARVYLMGGDVIACNEPDAAARLGQLLVNNGALAAQVVAEALAAAGDMDLGDHLVRQKLVAGGDVMSARTQLFRDAFLTAAAVAAPGMDFEAQDAVFPDNMQFGVDRAELIGDARGWLDLTTQARALVADPERAVVAMGDKPNGLSDAAWARLGEPLSGQALVDALALSREEALLQLASLLDAGALVPPDEWQDAPTEALDDLAALQSVHDEPAELGLESVEGLDDDEDVPAEAEVHDEDVHDEEEDDYERAKRGAFIKSYEVLDKVDLSGVKVLGAGDPAEHEHEIEAVALEMGDEDDAVALGDDDDELDEVFAALDDAPPTTAPQLARLHQEQPEGAVVDVPGDDDFAMFDTGEEVVEAEFQVEDISGNYEAAAILDEDDSGVLVTGEEVAVAAEAGPFMRAELAEFHERIDIFNNIFRIIYRTFSEHIGPDNALQRFNALLSSNQRQYPELFADILVADDGSVQPAPLINNLSNCTAGDYGSLLHQGLYELIFSHLYDAKDMLPGDVESGMMEQILVFERQLHQG